MRPQKSGATNSGSLATVGLLELRLSEMVVMDRPALARANAGAPGVDEMTFAQIEVSSLEAWRCTTHVIIDLTLRVPKRRTGLNRKVAITLWQLPRHAGGGIIHSW
jgi:hypothetical protein